MQDTDERRITLVCATLRVCSIHQTGRILELIVSGFPNRRHPVDSQLCFDRQPPGDRINLEIDSSTRPDERSFNEMDIYTTRSDRDFLVRKILTRYTQVTALKTLHVLSIFKKRLIRLTAMQS